MRTPPLTTIRRVERVLLVHPGHSFSTHDVFFGLLRALRRRGITVSQHIIAEYMEASRDWLSWVHSRWGDGEVPQPEEQDILYQAGKTGLITALEQGVDLAVFVSGLLIEPRVYALFRRAGIPIFVYGTESPYNDREQTALATFADYFSTNEAASVAVIEDGCREAGAQTRVIHLGAAYDATVHNVEAVQPRLDGVPRHDVVFVGTYFSERVAFLERYIALLQQRRPGTDVGLYGHTALIPEGSPIQSCVVDGVQPNDRAVALAVKSGVALNLFRTGRIGADGLPDGDAAAGLDVSPRVMELAACGACLISEYRPGVKALFGHDLPTFESPEQAVMLTLYYLDLAEAAATLRTRLPELVSGHSFDERVKTIVSEVEQPE